ncbi:MAG TPA: hypothetical protein VGB52_02150 [Actinomycetota bacterium]
MRAITATLALAATVLLVPAPGSAVPGETPIQPGAKIFSPVGQCTMNFVFTDPAGTLYIGTAGHCARVGDRVSSEEGSFGTAVYSHRTTVKDFALIRIDTDRYDQVDPAVRAWGGPTGHTTATETTIGDPLLQYGFGIGFGEAAETRQRLGPMSNDSFTRYRAYVPSNFGDSGSPVLHAATGKALGVVVEFAYATGLSEGPTVEAILADLAAEGYALAVVTAPWEPFIPN